MEETIKNMLDSYDKLSINDKRNELNTLFLEMNAIITKMFNLFEVDETFKIKNYDINRDGILDESKMLNFTYEDAWKIKQNLVLLAGLLMSNLNK